MLVLVGVERVADVLRLGPRSVIVQLAEEDVVATDALVPLPGRVLSRDRLLDLTQGRAAGPFERSIDILISRIRRKIELDPHRPEIIKTVRSGGYLFAATVESR